MNKIILLAFFLNVIYFTVRGEEVQKTDENVGWKDDNVIEPPEFIDDNSDPLSLYEKPAPPFNVTVDRPVNNANQTRKYVQCKKFNATAENPYEPAVEVLDSIGLNLTSDPEITSKDIEGDCLLILFFATVCPFSSQAAPHFNALARAFPDIKMVALDALKFHGINTQYGIVGVPTLKLFHNGRPVAKFNGTEYNIHTFSKFVQMNTGLEAEHAYVTSKDFQGPVSSIVERELDYFLVISWLFIIICGIDFFGKSVWWKTIVETIQNNWRESEAQHEHTD